MNATDIFSLVQTMGSVLSQGLHDAHGATQNLMAMRPETGPITAQEILAFAGSISPATMACMILWQRIPSNTPDPQRRGPWIAATMTLVLAVLPIGLP
jgi:hypothetical protein